MTSCRMHFEGFQILTTAETEHNSVVLAAINLKSVLTTQTEYIEAKETKRPALHVYVETLKRERHVARKSIVHGDPER